MRSTARVGKGLSCQFVLLHKEARPETQEISTFYPRVRDDTTVLFVIQAFTIHTYNDGKAIFWDETVSPRTYG